jgi:acetoin utilization deacetylase AcuC-like enzyme
MRCFWDERQRAHAPAAEFFNGKLHPAAEHPGRVDAILAAIGKTEAPADKGLGPIHRVHDVGYVDFLERAHAEWLAAGREGDAFPYTFPIVHRRARGWDRIDATLGHYSFDTSTPIGAGTWEACYWSVQTALAGLEAVVAGERAAFAFTRPPGHHAGGDYFGGYSYLNHAAICADAALAAGKRRVAILDVDYHHGNGTQQIFYERGDVLTISIHADPAQEFPYFLGYADEMGAGLGEGYHLNLPLAWGATWLEYERALNRAVKRILEYGAEVLVVSLGLDTFEHDPISRFKLRHEDYLAMGAKIAGCDLPTLFVMEGGYAVDALGVNTVNVLQGFERG